MSPAAIRVLRQANGICRKPRATLLCQGNGTAAHREAVDIKPTEPAILLPGKLAAIQAANLPGGSLGCTTRANSAWAALLAGPAVPLTFSNYSLAPLRAHGARGGNRPRRSSSVAGSKGCHQTASGKRLTLPVHPHASPDRRCWRQPALLATYFWQSVAQDFVPHRLVK